MNEVVYLKTILKRDETYEIDLEKHISTGSKMGGYLGALLRREHQYICTFGIFWCRSCYIISENRVLQKKNKRK